MKRLLCIFKLVVVVISCQAQQADTFALIYGRNHHSIQLATGINRSSFEYLSGEYKPKGATGWIFKGNYQYTYNFSPRAGLRGSAGFGIFPAIFKMRDQGNFYGTDGWSYFQLVSYVPFTELSLGPEIRFPINSRYLMQVNAGLNRSRLANWRSGIGYGSIDSLGNETYQAEVNINPSLKAVHSLSLGAGITRRMKNLDLLRLDLTYQYFFRNVFEGKYFTYPPDLPFSTGMFLNRGHSLNMSLAYVFTRTNKHLKKEELSTAGKDKNKAWREYRAQSRPLNAYYLTGGLGLSFGVNRSHDAQKVLLTSLPVSPIGSVSLIKEFREKYFWEAGLNYHEYWQGAKYNTEKLEVIGLGGWGNAFTAWQLSLGGGYRLHTSGEKHLASLHGGIAAAITADYLHTGSAGEGGSFTIDQNNDTIPHIYYHAYKFMNIFPLLYVGISRDMRIAGNFYFVPAYRFNQGILRVQEQRYTYDLPEQDIKGHAIVSINGSYHTFQIGFKVKIGNAPLHRNMRW